MQEARYLPPTTFLPSLTVDVAMFDKICSGAFAELATNDTFIALQSSAHMHVSKILPSLNLNLTELGKNIKVDESVLSSYAYKQQQTKPIETWPKSLEDFKNVFPNFVSPEKTPLVPALSSLEARRTLHEDTKQDLNPIEKLLDANFKEMHSTIQQALSAARAARISFDEKLLSGPIHPYQRLIYDYLGPDFKTPSIYDLETPQNFCPVTSLQKLNNITDSFFENTMTHFRHLTAGIGKVENDEERAMMEGLGHGFGVLSATSQGMEFVIDRKKAAEYLEFVETVRNIPIKEIVNNPIEIAQRIIHRITAIFAEESQPRASVNILPESASSKQQEPSKNSLNEKSFDQEFQTIEALGSSNVTRV